MEQGPASVTLEQYLQSWAMDLTARVGVAAAIKALAQTSIEMSERVGKGALLGRLGKVTARAGEFDEQKEIDVLANEAIIKALKGTEVAAFASEEMSEPLELREDAPLLVAADPLDGSSNVDANVSFGMIFSILPRLASAVGEAAFLRPGSYQLAAGMAIYGPATVLVITVGSGTHIFTLDRCTNTFLLTYRNVAIPPATREYAINASNARYWDDTVRIFIHECENGASGPRGKDYNMRWTGSPVADIFRILSRGGIYLYPGDARPGFHAGRIRLVYEANPIAWLIEQAGGRATTGQDRLLDVVPGSLHQKTPLICGSREEVDHLARLYGGSFLKGEHNPLFGRRGLFRAW
ncbi:MAG TPA: class 1 fructose-bisphosphatase [Hyphomicrobium sp.]|nr:class 1 fructose-bisphosphatase [Hyphomicrobium sp.]